MMRAKLDEEDYKNAALKLRCEIEVIKAVDEVESNGSGFNEDGSPKILFEAHRFYRELQKIGIDPEQYKKGNEDIIQRYWSDARKYYLGKEAEYTRLIKATELLPDKKALAPALKSASWGRFQILGSNHKYCGYTDVILYVMAMDLSEKKHLDAFVNFVISKGIDKHMRNKDWNNIARLYNGSAYKTHNYHIRMENEYKRLKNG